MGSAAPVGKRREPVQRPHLEQTISVGDDGEPETVMDRLVSMIRNGAFVNVAAAAVGLSGITVSRYLRDGGQVLRKIHHEGADPASFTEAELLYADFAERVGRAEAENEMMLVLTATNAARGGLKKVTVTTRLDADGNALDSVRKEEIVPPDASMIRWLLAHRFVDRWGHDVLEISGPGGGPIEVSTEDRREAILAKLGVIAERLNPAPSEEDIVDAEVLEDSDPPATGE